MNKRTRIIDNFGPYLAHPPVGASCELSKKIFERYHTARGGHERSGESGTEHLLTKLMYLGESTSTAVRMNASWSLTLPAMSILRDRYEQTVRFSWLARQADSFQLAAFIDAYYAKAAKIIGNVSTTQWRQLPDYIQQCSGIQPPLTKEERIYLGRWESLDLRSMAQKRDKLPPKTSSLIETQTLADLYVAVYQQFSSVSHADMFGLNIIGLHPDSNGRLIMAPDPQWPALLCLFNCLFDIIQCHDALSGFVDAPPPPQLEDVFGEWIAVRDKILGAAP